MMRKITFTLLFCLFFIASHAQNWEAFTSNRTCHFKSDTATALADISIHVDSVRMLALDSSFSIARRMVFPVDTSLRNMPMFTGREVIAQANGVFNFKNPGNFAIPTHAQMGVPFVLDSLSGLSAAVTRKYQGMVLGLTLDSIKVFTTAALDSLVLSKSFGVLEWPSSMGGSRYVLSGIQELGVGDTLPGFDGFFDYQVGADYFFKSTLQQGDLIVTNDSFLVRFRVDSIQTISGGKHVVFSGVERHNQGINGTPILSESRMIGGSFDLEDTPTSILRKSHHEQVRAPKAMSGFRLPDPWATYNVTGAADSMNSAWNGLWTTMTYHRNAGKTELLFGRSNGAVGWLYHGIGGDSCVRSNIDQIRATFREGVGISHVEFASFAQSGTFELVGSIINGDTSGTVFPDSVILATRNIISAPLVWSVSPIPAQDRIHVQWTASKPCEIQLMDLTGKVLWTLAVHGLNAEMDVQELATGMYLLSLTQGNVRDVKRIVIAR